MKKLVMVAAIIGGVMALTENGKGQTDTMNDPWRWLEDVDSKEALDWVRHRNSRFLQRAEADPIYSELHDRLLEMFDDTAKIDYPSIRGDQAYNFWQSAENERGIVRRKSLDDYLADRGEWEIVLDVDQLAEDEVENWVFQGSTVLESDPRYTIVRLSRGGADAAVMREFDTETKEFVKDGFNLSEAKSRVAWVDRDNIIVATDFGEGSMTTSGYPRTLRLWRRGTPLENAETIFAGEETDVSVSAWVHHGTRRSYTFVERGTTFYSGETWLLEDSGLMRVGIPDDALMSMFDDIMILKLQTDWEVSGHTFLAGSAISINIHDFIDGNRRFTLLHQPGDRETLEYFLTGKDYVYFTTLENVRGRLYKCSWREGKWKKERLELPALGSIDMISHDEKSNRLFLTYTDFLTPTTLYYYDPDESDEIRAVRHQPSYFDSDPYTVDQLEATSSDGTLIPYFVLRRKDLAYDGTAPTILYGYGGFRVSMTPSYSGSTGIAWLEKGGVYVVANIRGGGEFGPAWHASALRENRQRPFDDFIAVAEDLTQRKITSPANLGISGGSNGGLLVGAVFTQRPDLMNAVSCGVPLLDMRNYHTMLAGASWMEEYGNPDIPEEWEFISRYSPYHNLREDETYPEVLFITSTRDDRVHPGHARKMAARMEEMGHPYLYYENIEGGHGGAANNEQMARRVALSFVYFLWKLSEIRDDG
jgi:prolyl oligopeptidase